MRKPADGSLQCVSALRCLSSAWAFTTRRKSPRIALCVWFRSIRKEQKRSIKSAIRHKPHPRKSKPIGTVPRKCCYRSCDASAETHTWQKLQQVRRNFWIQNLAWEPWQHQLRPLWSISMRWLWHLGMAAIWTEQKNRQRVTALLCRRPFIDCPQSVRNWLEFYSHLIHGPKFSFRYYCIGCPHHYFSLRGRSWAFLAVILVASVKVRRRCLKRTSLKVTRWLRPRSQEAFAALRGPAPSPS